MPDGPVTSGRGPALPDSLRLQEDSGIAIRSPGRAAKLASPGLFHEKLLFGPQTGGTIGMDGGRPFYAFADIAAIKREDAPK